MIFFRVRLQKDLKCDQSTRKFIKVLITPCNNIMTFETRIATSNLNVIPIYLF